MVKKVDAPTGSYHFISTRNNNFSNRAHTLKIDVWEGRGREAEIRAQAAASTAVAGGFGGAIVALIVLGLIGVAVYMIFFKGKGGDDESSTTPKATIPHPKGTTTGGTRV